MLKKSKYKKSTFPQITFDSSFKKSENIKYQKKSRWGLKRKVRHKRMLGKVARTV